jgi:copper chaperone
VWKLLGRRTVVLYLVTIAIAAVGAGLALDWLQLTLQFNLPDLGTSCHDAAAGHWASSFWAILLLAVLGSSYAIDCFRRKGEAVHEHSDADSAQPREQIELTIEGMTCDHCVAHVTNALMQCQGVTSVRMNPVSGQGAVLGEHLDGKELVAAVEAAGYRASIVNGLASR